MGTPEFAAPSLRALHNNYEVVAVVTAPDKPAGRGQEVRSSPIKAYAEEQGLTLAQPENLKDPAFIAWLRSLRPDLIAVVAFRKLPEQVWRAPRHGAVNLHASLLPDYRGAAPINHAIINGEETTGLTTFFLDDKIDTGAVIEQEEVPIPYEATAGRMHDIMMEAGADLMLATVKKIDYGMYSVQKQDDEEAVNAAPKIYARDCKIDWNQPMVTLYNFIRGLSPRPCAWTTLDGQKLKIYFAKMDGQEPTAPDPGKLLASKDRILAGARDGWMELTDLQLEGRKRMDAAEFLNGYKFGKFRFD